MDIPLEDLLLLVACRPHALKNVHQPASFGSQRPARPFPRAGGELGSSFSCSKPPRNTPPSCSVCASASHAPTIASSSASIVLSGTRCLSQVCCHCTRKLHPSKESAHTSAEIAIGRKIPRKDAFCSRWSVMCRRCGLVRIDSSLCVPYQI